MTPLEAAPLMAGWRKSLEDCLAALETDARRLPVAEREYRLARRRAWSECPDGQAKLREDWVDAESAAEREARDEAKELASVWRDAIRIYLAEISSVQTELGAFKSEAKLAATGPEYAP